MNRFEHLKQKPEFKRKEKLRPWDGLEKLISNAPLNAKLEEFLEGAANCCTNCKKWEKRIIELEARLKHLENLTTEQEKVDL
jgi:hypothetical protein